MYNKTKFKFMSYPLFCKSIASIIQDKYRGGQWRGKSTKMNNTKINNIYLNTDQNLQTLDRTRLLEKWNDFYFLLDKAQLLTKISIFISLQKFWDNIFLPSNQENPSITKLYIIFKVSFLTTSSYALLDRNVQSDKANQIRGEIRSISFMQKVGINDFESLLEIFNEFWLMRSEQYHSMNVLKIIYTYKMVSNETLSISSNSKLIRTFLPKENKEKEEISFSGINLPNTMDLTDWGETTFFDDYSKAIVFKSKSKLEYHVSLFNDHLIAEVKYDEKTLFTFTDTRSSSQLFEKDYPSFMDRVSDLNDLSTFTRKLEVHSCLKKETKRTLNYIYIKGKCVLKTISRNCKYLKPSLEATYRSHKFLTMDIETKEINNILIPRCVSISDGKNEYSFEITDHNNDYEKMLNAAIKFLMKRKYSGYKVYLHNFSYFDSVFLLRILSNLCDKFMPISRDGRLITVPFHFGKNLRYVIHFRDSLLMLPMSLAKLAKSFDVENKGQFPHSFVNNSNISSDYYGPIPDKKYFKNMTACDYLLYCLQYPDGKWSLKNETIKYCEQDVRTLYQIIDKFSERIFNLFRVDILKYPTLSSLGFGIYRSVYLNNTKISLITGKWYHFLKKGYTGGAVDVYKPIGKKIYRYDVNSLYPHVMANTPMPVGQPVFFEGDISLTHNIKDLSGFFEVEVQAPNNLNIPFLQTKAKTVKSGIRTIAALGNWKSVYHANEIKKGLNLGYKFNFIRGVLFKEADIFSEMIKKLYEIKEHSDKGSSDYIISKLLMNSLYGRFGMSPDMESHIVISEKEAEYFYENYIISNILNFKNGKVLISYITNRSSEELDTESDMDRALNINVAIAATITANSRIFMYKFKSMPGYIPYYSDTDSIDLNKPLPPENLGTGLGLMKLEHVFDEAIYLAPKVYGGITEKYEYVKVKGLKNPIPYLELKSLLKKNAILEIPQEKWHRYFDQGQITIKNEMYTLMATDNKRELIYDENNKIVDTRPLYLDQGEIFSASS
jgi:hypothetical protein